MVEDVAEGAQEALRDVATHPGFVRQEERQHVLQRRAHDLDPEPVATHHSILSL